MSTPLPTIAILEAEEATERWCCPICGGLNSAEVDPTYPLHENFAYLGWCQHEYCLGQRFVARLFGTVTFPEILSSILDTYRPMVVA